MADNKDDVVNRLGRSILTKRLCDDELHYKMATESSDPNHSGDAANASLEHSPARKIMSSHVVINTINGEEDPDIAIPSITVDTSMHSSEDENEDEDDVPATKSIVSPDDTRNLYANICTEQGLAALADAVIMDELRMNSTLRSNKKTDLAQVGYIILVATHPLILSSLLSENLLAECARHPSADLANVLSELHVHQSGKTERPAIYLQQPRDTKGNLPSPNQLTTEGD